jgi:hypothetical protein
LNYSKEWRICQAEIFFAAVVHYKHAVAPYPHLLQLDMLPVSDYKKLELPV